MEKSVALAWPRRRERKKEGRSEQTRTGAVKDSYRCTGERAGGERLGEVYKIGRKQGQKEAKDNDESGIRTHALSDHGIQEDVIKGSP